MLSDNAYEEALWDEIFGCVKHLKLPYDTVMSLPVHIRKYWIMKHNNEVEEEQKKYNDSNNGTSSGSLNINQFAGLEQEKLKNNYG